MAVILSEKVSGKRCWGCGREIKEDESAIVATGAREVIYLHSHCAGPISRMMLRDLSQLIDLGYEIEDEQRR